MICFIAKITAKTSSGGKWLYSWEEQVADPNTFSYALGNPGRRGSATYSPAYEINNTEVNVNTLVLMYQRGYYRGQIVYEFVAPDTSSSALAPATIIGATWDGASATTIDAAMATLRVDTRDGLSLANVSAGIDLLTIADASASQAGIVSTTAQTIAGQKTLKDGAIIRSPSGQFRISGDSSDTYYSDFRRQSALAALELYTAVIGIGATYVTFYQDADTPKTGLYINNSVSSGDLDFTAELGGTGNGYFLLSSSGVSNPEYRIRYNGTTYNGATHTSVFGDVYRGGILTAAASAYNLDDLSNVTVPTPTNGDVLQWNGAAWINTPGSSLGSGGTVTSVALTVPSILSVSGSPITTSGTLGVTLQTQSANVIFAGPSSGGAATPTFRSLVTDDLANDIVTYAKLQNVSATSRILGRKSASAGDTEECTLSEILDFVGSAAQGDILYRGASTWTRLGAGTAGYVLQTGGAGANPSWVPRREVLIAARTYYVRTDGNDSNTGLANTAGGAFLTIQKAIDVITGTLDTAGYAVTISVGSGTFTNALTLKPITGGGTVSIVGAGLASTTISTTSAVCITGDGCGGGWTVTNLKMTTATSGSCISMTQGALTIANVAFGTVQQYHIFTSTGGLVYCRNNYTINGNAQNHWFAQGGGAINVQSNTITLTGTPAFSLEFARSRTGSVIGAGITFSGSATGTRYYALANGSIDTNGGGATYLPGNSAGSTASGGQYI